MLRSCCRVCVCVCVCGRTSKTGHLEWALTNFSLKDQTLKGQAVWAKRQS